MTFPVLVEPCGGQFAASLAGAPAIRAVELTRLQAVSALEEKIQQCIKAGELLSLEIDTLGISSLAGKYSTDPMLREICENAYKIRDAEAEYKS